ARSAPAVPAAAPAPAPAAPAPVPAAAPAPASAQPSAAAQQGAAQVRQMWPQILEAVKNRRRFTWILLSQNGQVAGFDGSVLQVSFVNAGARDSFVGSHSDEVLRQALADALGVDWRVECIIDPSGGSAAPSGPPAGGGGGGWGTAPARPAPAAPPAHQAPAPVPAPAAQPSAGQPVAPPQPGPAAQSAPPAAPAPYRAPQPAPVAPEDDVPEDDDPDLTEEAFSGQELIIRELGATVLEEIHHNT
ncbi:DNA polymerase III subunit gamma and tau, partial [Kitasatospora sp. NPDC059571]